MKKRMLLAVLLALCVLLMPLAAFAEGDAGTPVKFVSKKLEGFAREVLGLGAKDPIYAEQLAGIKKMTLTGESMTTGYRAQFWEHIDEDGLENVKLDDLKHFTGLTCLRLQLGEMPIANLKVLGELTGLKQLFLMVDSVKNLDMLAGLTNLEELAVSANGVKTIEPLAGLSALKTLYLRCEDLEDIAVLDQLDNVKHLTLTSCPKVTSIAPVCGMEHITQLNLESVGVRTLEPLRAMSRKFSLRAENVFVQDWSAAYGFGSSELVNMVPEEIEFVSDRFEKQLRKAIGREDDQPIYNTELATITELTITHGKIELGYNYYKENRVRTQDNYGKAMPLDDLVHFPQLISLLLDIPYNTSESLAPLAQMADLNTLCLRGNKLTDLSVLGSVLYLETLEIAGKGITDISVVQNMSILDEFSMYGTSVESIEPLRNLKYIGSGTVRIGQCKKLKDLSPIDHVGDKQIVQ